MLAAINFRQQNSKVKRQRQTFPVLFYWLNQVRYITVQNRIIMTSRIWVIGKFLSGYKLWSNVTKI